MTVVDNAHTRAALHADAELVLAGPQHKASGTIKLRVSPGGFCTWAEPAIGVVGTSLIVDGTGFPISGRTARELAAAAGRLAGAPLDVYIEGSGAQIDDALVVDPAAAARIAAAFALGDTALRLLAPDTEPVLWPEHFDVGVRIDGINYGVSPGDSYLGEPYAYVGVDPMPADDQFWNAPFGTAEPVTSFLDATELLAFFTEARRRAGLAVADGTATPDRSPQEDGWAAQ